MSGEFFGAGRSAPRLASAWRVLDNFPVMCAMGRTPAATLEGAIRMGGRDVLVGPGEGTELAGVVASHLARFDRATEYDHGIAIDAVTGRTAGGDR